MNTKNSKRALRSLATLLGLFAVVLTLTLPLIAGPHAKKQADLAPNSVGDTTATANGTHIRFAGIPNFTYSVERSEDGTNWITVSSLVAPKSGLMEYLDPNAQSTAPFYRTTAR
jgi:hypothetical protein